MGAADPQGSDQVCRQPRWWSTSRRRQKPDVERAFNAIANHETLLQLGEFPPVYLDLLAMIQATTSSPTVMEPFGLTPTPSSLFDRPSDQSRQAITLPPRAAGFVFDLGLPRQSAI